MTAYVKLAIAVALFLAGFWIGWEWRDRSADVATAETDAAAAQAQTHALELARATEQTAGQTMAGIGAKHEDDRTAAEAVPAAVVADLRAGNLRLRSEWQGCEANRMSDAAAAAGERDALAAERDALAGAVVRVGRDADDQLRACQAVVQADRAAINGGEGQR